MCEIRFSVPDETLLALKITPEEMQGQLRMAAAAKLYELGRLSSGAAAALAGIPRTLFLGKLAEYGVDAFDMDKEEIDRETRLA